MTLWKLTLSYAVYIKLHNKYFKIPSRFRKFHYNFWQAKHNFYSVISKPSSTKRPQTEATQPNHPFVCRHITNSHLTPSKTIHQTKIKYLSKTHTTTEAAERDGPRHCDTSLFDMEHHIGDDNSWFPANRTIIYVMACDTESDYTKKKWCRGEKVAQRRVLVRLLVKVGSGKLSVMNEADVTAFVSGQCPRMEAFDVSLRGDLNFVPWWELGCPGVGWSNRSDGAPESRCWLVVKWFLVGCLSFAKIIFE